MSSAPVPAVDQARVPRAPVRAWRRLPVPARRAIRFLVGAAVLGYGAWLAMVGVLLAMMAASGRGLFGPSEPSPGPGLIAAVVAAVIGTATVLITWWAVRGVRPSRRVATVVALLMLAVALGGWIFGLTGVERPPG